MSRYIMALFIAAFFFVLTLGAQAQSCGADVCVGQSWQAAYTAAAYGEEVTLEPGAHPAQSLYFVASKASEADEPNVVFQGGPGVSVGNITGYGIRHVTFSGIAAGDVVFECEDSGIPVEARGQHPLDLALIDSKVRTTRSENASNLLIARNEIGPSSTVNKIGASGDVGGGNCTDEPPDGISYLGNDIHNFRESSDSAHMECVFVEGGRNIVFEGNIIRGCSVFGIFFKQQLAAGAFGPLTNIRVCNNFLGHPVASAFRPPGARSISFSSGSYVNLTVCSNSVNGRIELRTDLVTSWTNVVVEDNLVNDRGGDCARPGIAWQRNAYLALGQSCPDDLASGVASGWMDVEGAVEISSSTSDPTINYHLGSGAWAIDRSASGPAEDFDGQARPIGTAFDVGADEVGQAGPPPDTTPPVLLLPADITVEAPDLLGALVAYAVSATDDTDPAPSFSCAPGSSSLFPVGATQVLCSARDAAGNASQGTFLVTVLAPVDDPPSSPGDLAVAAYTQRTVTISWPGATDDVGIAGYHLYLDGTFLATAGPLARQAKFSVTWAEHTIVIEAVDSIGQRTASSIAVKGVWVKTG